MINSLKRVSANTFPLAAAGALIFVSLCLPVKLNAQQMETLDNAKIIELAKSGIGDQIIIAKINASKVAVDLSETGLLQLKGEKISDDVILALLQRSAVRGAKDVVCRAGQITLHNNTELRVSAVEKISGKAVKIGQAVTLAVAEDVLIGKEIVIAKGTAVKATVSDARKPGMMGRSGRLSITVESTMLTDGQTIKIRSGKSGKDGDNFGSTFTMVVIFGAAGLLRHGKNAKIEPGTVFPVFTDELKCLTSSKTP